MTHLKILFVEDNMQDISVLESAIEVYNERHQTEILLVLAKNYHEALTLLDQESFDGMILDLYLGYDSENGKDILDHIQNQKIIIPTVVLTGTPDDLPDYKFIELNRKGDDSADFDRILNNFEKTKKAGILELFGATGDIQTYLKDVFYQNIYHQKDHWLIHEDLNKVKKALLRHTLNHLTQYIDEEDDIYFLEEMYIFPPISKKIKTGSIIKKKEPSSNFFIVLTPACDIAQSKAQCILLAEILFPKSMIEKNVPGTGVSNNRKGRLKEFIKNKDHSFHFLPPSFDFNGGFIHFASISSISPQELLDSFTETKIQVSPFFIKDIISRFSSFYARQGQPDLNHKFEYFSDLL